MASILKVDALQGVTSAGDITVTSEGGSATQSLQQGLAKCSVKFSGTLVTSSEDTTGVSYSLNISSLVDVSTGKYKININNNMNSADYTISPSVSPTSGGTTDFSALIERTTNPPASGSCGVAAVRISFYDPDIVCCMIHGDLA